MHADELKELWSKQPPPSAGEARVSPALVWRLASESSRFERTIFWRDLREWLATILLAGAFLYTGCAHKHIHWPIVGAAIIVFLPMTYVAIRNRKRPKPEASANLTSHLRDSIAELRLQVELLRSVGRWYLAPIALSGLLVGADVFFTTPVPIGMRGRLLIPLLFGAVVTSAVFYGVWKLNQSAARNRLEPRLRQLEEILTELET